MSLDDKHIDWPSLGQQFRQQREAAGISLEAAARQLCLAKSQILALEEGLSANFPGAPARLWCARRYATLLGIDLDTAAPLVTASDAPEVLVRDTPTVLDNSLSDSEHLFRTPSATMGKTKARWLFMLLFFALVAALAIRAYDTSSPVPIKPEPVAMPEVPPPAIPVPAPAPEVIPAAPIEESRPEPRRKLVEIHGIEAHKPARSVYVMANEAVVLIKQREGQEGETLSLAKGTSQRIPFVADERLRVAEGKNLGIFYQGRKVSANTIESGNWMRFVPLRSVATQ